jgi:hypothetical protein
MLLRLNDIAKALRKICELYEMDLQYRGVYKPEAVDITKAGKQAVRAPGYGDDPLEEEVIYTDEELDYARELAEALGRKVKEAEGKGVSGTVGGLRVD